MVYLVYFNNELLSQLNCDTVLCLKDWISEQYGSPVKDLSVTIHGKLVRDDYNLRSFDNVVRVSTRLVGGKGVSGSMLRAIGARIEKTTDQEVCLNLSGNCRICAFNEQKRLRKLKLDAEREAAEKKQKKQKRLLAKPKIALRIKPLISIELDPEYEKAPQELLDAPKIKPLISVELDPEYEKARPELLDAPTIKPKISVELDPECEKAPQELLDAPKMQESLDAPKMQESLDAPKMQKLLDAPKIKPKISVELDPEYEKARQELPDRVSAAVDAGWEAAGRSNNSGLKRKTDAETGKWKKKAKLWIDAELSDCSSLSEDEDDEPKPQTSPTISTDSGNESDRTPGASSKLQMVL